MPGVAGGFEYRLGVERHNFIEGHTQPDTGGMADLLQKCDT